MARIVGLWWLLLLGAVAGLELSDEQYYQLPRMFRLDDYDACLASHAGAFCLGEFQLKAPSESFAAHALMNVMQEFSQERGNFNHTLLRRGYCVSARCSHIAEPNLTARFEKCVNHNSVKQYGLQATLKKLDYCKTGADPPKPIDAAEIVFACVVMVIVVLNVVGTAYDVLRNQDAKPNRFLAPWSVLENWRRLMDSHENGDPQLNALNPAHGIRASLVLIVMLVHSVIVYYMGYVHNTRYFELMAREPLSMFFQNSTQMVQVFYLLSSFLFTYNLLRLADAGRPLSLRLLPQCVLYRAVRLMPVHLFVVGLTATWWARASSGPLWEPLLVQEAERCRVKWWAHALFIHNFYKPDDRCLIQTWFLAVDMQVFVPTAALALALAPRPAVALRVLSASCVAAVAANFYITYLWDLRPLVQVVTPELTRAQYVGVDSFKWSYTAPWSSLPSSLLGVAVSFIYHRQVKAGTKPTSKWFLAAYYLYVPLQLSWLFAGHWVPMLRAKLAWAFYAALDRPLCALYGALTLIGLFHNIDSRLYRFLSHPAWRVPSRLSLSLLMAHWLLDLAQAAVHTLPLRASVFTIGGHWLMTIILALASAVPLHVAVEAPLQRLVRQLLF